MDGLRYNATSRAYWLLDFKQDPWTFCALVSLLIRRCHATEDEMRCECGAIGPGLGTLYVLSDSLLLISPQGCGVRVQGSLP